MIIHPGHAPAHQNLPVGNQPLVYQLVKHRVQRTFLRDDSSAALPLRFLHKLIAIHILFLQQSQNHQRHHAPAKAHLSVICCHAIPLPLRYIIIQYFCFRNTFISKILLTNFLLCVIMLLPFSGKHDLNRLNTRKSNHSGSALF